MRYKLSELIEVKHGFAFKGKDFSEEPTEFILVTPGNFNIGGGFNSSKEKYFSDNTTYPKEYDLSPGDLIITMTDLSKQGDTLGYPAIVPNRYSKRYLHNQRIGKVIIKKPDVIDKIYLYFLLRTREYRHHILATSTGTTVKHTAPKKILSYEVNIPSLSDQKKVSSLLFNIEDKIHANEAIINNLELIANTIFNRWFIDFEFPDVEGRPYRLSGGKMVLSDIGEIPMGWKITSLKEVAIYSNTSFNPKTTEIEEVNHFSMPAFDEKAYPIKDKTSEIKSNKYILEELSVLFSKMNPTTPRVWLPNFDKEELNVCSTEFVVLNSPDAPTRSLVYEICKSNAFNKYLVSNSAGSTNSRQRVRPAIAIDYHFAYQKGTAKKFGEAVSPIHEKILALREENIRLTELRNTLLPKLLSGEIELPQDSEVTVHEPV